MKTQYDKKKRTRLVEISLGDWVYRRNTTPTTTRGPWEPIPFLVVHIQHNQITGRRQGEESTRDRSDWKLVVARPAHLEPFQKED